MASVDAVLTLVAVAASTGLVLRDVAAAERPAGGPPAPDDPPAPAPELTLTPVLGVGVVPVAAPVDVAATVPVEVEPEPVREREPVREPPPRHVPVVAEASMLATLTATEHDERSAVRRVGALAVLLTLTLLTAAGVYAVIYKTVSGLG